MQKYQILEQCNNIDQRFVWKHWLVPKITSGGFSYLWSSPIHRSAGRSGCKDPVRMLVTHLAVCGAELCMNMLRHRKAFGKLAGQPWSGLRQVGILWQRTLPRWSVGSWRMCSCNKNIMGWSNLGWRLPCCDNEKVLQPSMCLLPVSHSLPGQTHASWMASIPTGTWNLTSQCLLCLVIKSEKYMCPVPKRWEKEGRHVALTCSAAKQR